MSEAFWLKELGPYALFIIFAIYIILKDFGLILKRKNGDNSVSFCRKVEDSIMKTHQTLLQVDPLIQEMTKKVDELHRWHDIVDSDGVKVWYVRKSLEEAIIKLADNISVQTEILRSVVTLVKRTDEDVKRALEK
jgi:hypothetical protein